MLLTPYIDWRWFDPPNWVWMAAMALAVYALCKRLSWRDAPATAVSGWRQFAYLVVWPGMDARAFLWQAPLPNEERPSTEEWMFAFFKVGLGVLLFGIVPGWIPEEHDLVRGWIAMAGLAMMLHFGVFHCLSCLWRSLWIDARPLMDWPLVSASLGEFWGRRWNRAFRDLAHRFLFRPLTPWFGARAALLIGFLVSGVIHDLVISVPAKGGYGGPTLYFLIQALGLLAERSRAGRALGLGRGLSGWLFTMAVATVPAFWLFHPPFVRNVILPMMTAMGAI